MQPTNLNLKAIARDATLRGDTKALFHALDLLERVVPIATFMDFCTELDELQLQGGRPRPHENVRNSSTQQHWLCAMSATLAKQFAGFARCCLELARPRPRHIARISPRWPTSIGWHRCGFAKSFRLT